MTKLLSKSAILSPSFLDLISSALYFDNDVITVQKKKIRMKIKSDELQWKVKKNDILFIDTEKNLIGNDS